MTERLETFLPTKRRFDSHIGEIGDLLEDVINDICEQTNDILDIDKETDRDMLAVWELSRRLTDALANPEHEDMAKIQLAMYRAIVFALQVVDEIKEEPITSLRIGEYVNDDQWNEDQLNQDTQNYFAESPSLDTLISKYMPEIDTSGRHGHHAETAAALVFMLAEREVAIRHIRQSFDDAEQG
jgi:hypothetical protein